MGKYLVTVVPNMDAGAASGSAYSDDDVLFTWTKFDIPKGPVELKSITATIAGTDGVAGNTHDIGLYFARAIDGVAPASLGTIHAATTALLSNAFRRNIIGFKYLDVSAQDDTDHMIGYSVLGGKANGANYDQEGLVLQGDDTPFNGDSTYSATPQGYQSIWVGAIAHGAFNFGSEIHLNDGSNVAADITGNDVTLTIDQGGGSTGVANNSFQVGDILIGATGGPTMEITDMVSGTATSLKVKNISEQIDDDEELVLKFPIRLNFGFEY